MWVIEVAVHYDVVEVVVFVVVFAIIVVVWCSLLLLSCEIHSKQFLLTNLL